MKRYLERKWLMESGKFQDLQVSQQTGHDRIDVHNPSLYINSKKISSSLETRTSIWFSSKVERILSC